VLCSSELSLLRAELNVSRKTELVERFLYTAYFFVPARATRTADNLPVMAKAEDGDVRPELTYSHGVSVPPLIVLLDRTSFANDAHTVHQGTRYGYSST